MPAYWSLHVPREDNPRRWTRAEGEYLTVEAVVYAMLRAARYYGSTRAVRHELGLPPMLGRVATPATTVAMFREGTLVPGIPAIDGPLSSKGMAEAKRAKENA